MASKRFKQQFSDEERRAYKQAQLDTARERITEMARSWQQDPQEIADYLKFATSFYQYSPRNQMLIYSQRDTALFVASMKEWRRRGYSIKKGEHGLQILVPSPIKMFQDEDGKWLRQTSASAAQMEKIRRGELPVAEQVKFTVKPVFDITQTTCPVEDYPKLLGLGYNETQHAAMYAAAKEYCAAQGSEVKEELLDVSLRGFYRHADQSITINTMLGDTQRLSTLLHEFAHHALDHRTREISSAQKEFEADALSVMLEDRCGIPITDTRRAHLAKAYSEYVAEQQANGKTFSPEEAFKPVNEQYRLHNEALTAHFQSRDLTPIIEPTIGELPISSDPSQTNEPSPSLSADEARQGLAWLAQETDPQRSIRDLAEQCARELVNANDPTLSPSLREIEIKGITHQMGQIYRFHAPGADLSTLSPAERAAATKHIQAGTEILQQQVSDVVTGGGAEPTPTPTPSQTPVLPIDHDPIEP